MPDPSISASKDLYRRLERVLGDLPGGEGDGTLLTAAGAALWQAFAGSLGMTSARVEMHARGRVEVLATFGSPRAVARGRRELEPGTGLRLFDDGEGPPCAELEFHDEGRSWRLEFAFGPRWNRDAVELVLHTAASVLAARRSEARWGATLRQAAEIQQGLLPAGPPTFPGYEIAARSVPAEAVGGDWFDFLPLGEGSLGISIGDASGHGLPAALMARDVVIGLRMGIEQELRAGHVLEKLNRVLHRGTVSSRFASLLFGELEDSGSFFYYSAGHDAPLLVTDEGVRTLRTGGPVLGPLPEIHLRRHFAHLDHGALLALHTDGLVERRSPSGELFGAGRLHRLLSDHRSLPVDGVLDRVFEAAEAFAEGAGVRDDETLVLVRRER